MKMKILIKVAAISTLIILNSSCATKQGLMISKEGVYEIIINKSSSDNDPVISGHVYEFGTKNPVLGASVWNDKYYHIKTGVDLKGRFIYRTKPGKYKVHASFVGFRPSLTNSFAASKGDTVYIDFYLKL
ncbi:carboxypeptidase regulatory-like domain-containing protein [Pedobacter sp. UYP1]|uniref:carboxypeptidase regulatory-like domain-containing protein n=1 Tax=Pedobacter sp. UYP1 TaxID=1756396 RepID=UPI00339194D3